VAWSAATAKPPAKPATPYLSLDLARATGRYRELAAALPEVAVHYAVKAYPDPRLLARLHAAPAGTMVASVIGVARRGAAPSTATRHQASGPCART
jgi:diaminopimelate decarboxylase